MTLYGLCITLHLLAMSLWLGHMLVWSLFAGPALKAIDPPATAEMLRERSVYLGALGWPALAVLVPTGLYMLHYRGIGLGDLVTLSFLDMPGGGAIGLKLLLVLWMILYQAVWGHHRAPIAIYVNMAAALVILAASVVIVRGWA
ncbi:MAG TPA: hypothetical protein PKA13_05385 [Geminicoccaceae bacterium]|nr:hypothetical protein [Geminicoccus sp.]HMU49186.1 hypothetical protein [Geminicoccaceae bacterium]